MKVYEGETPTMDMSNSHTLSLFDDGRFKYDHCVWDYAGQGASHAEGTWRREGGVIHLLPVSGYDGYLWVRGQERRAVEHGDDLELERGPTLQYAPDREEVWPDYEHTDVVRNDTEHPMVVALEPSGERRTLGPGERARVHIRYPAGLGSYDYERTEHERNYYARDGAEIRFVPEPQQP